VRFSGARPPMPVADEGEIQPFGVIRKQWFTLKIEMEHLFEIAPSGIIIHIRKSCGFPSFGIALDDEGAGGFIEFIGMCGEDSGAVFAEDERQSMEQMPRAEPDVFVASRRKIGFEFILELGTNSAGYAIRTNDKIVATAAH
jgi:hypothetical protein